MKISSYIRKIKEFLINIIFPIKCPGCGIKDQVLCDGCLAKIELNSRETTENVIAIFDYRDPLIKKIIWELKYHHKRYLGEKLGSVLHDSLIENISELKIEVPARTVLVIPVPLSAEKLKKRGYNQSFYIAKGFCETSQDNFFELKDKIIFKKVETGPQAKISDRKKRLKNIQGVFDIKNKEEVKGRTIIVIDDVTTTGGTLGEIMKILKKSGAKSVYGFTIAH